jgi:ABC-2 type transport system permease protein
MNYLVKKELSYFFNSNIGVILLTIWFLSLGLILWVINGNYNIPLSGYATLHPFFKLAPLLMLILVPAIAMILVPAIAMRMLPKGKKVETNESTDSTPIKQSSTIVLRKFEATFLLVCTAIAPTLIYVVSIACMSMQGIDLGETISGYLGLVLVATAFSAMGLFCSSLTSNQFIALTIGVALNAIFYFGFNLIASIIAIESIHKYTEQFGIQYHYESLARGVIASNNIVYFISITVLFLWFTLLLNIRKK